MQIVVLGMHRSGTSLVTGLLHHMGAYVGAEDNILPARNDNPQGFWERKDVCRLNENVLKRSSARWYRTSRFTSQSTTRTTREAFNDEAQRILADLDSHQPWVMKDPRLCLLMPLWAPLLQSPLCICVHRNPLNVAFSLEKRNSFPIHFSYALWEKYTICAINASRAMPHCHLLYDDVIADPNATAEKLLEFLSQNGVKNMRRPATDVLSLYVKRKVVDRPRSPSAELRRLPSSHSDLWDRIVDGAIFDEQEALGVSRNAIAVMDDFERRDYSHFSLKKKWKYHRTRLLSALPLTKNRRD